MAEPDQKTVTPQPPGPRGLRIGISSSPVTPSEISLTPDEMREQLARAHAFYNRIATLGEIALQIDAARTRDDILQVLRSEAKWLIDYDVCFAGLVNRSRTHYLIASLSPIVDATDLDRKHIVLNQGMPGWVIQQQSPIAIDLSAGPEFAETVEGTLARLGMKSLLIVPMRAGTETIGALTFATARPSPYEEQEMWVAQLLAVQAATALKNTSIFDDAQKRLSQIELVNEIAEKLTSTLDIDALLTAAAETIQKAFNYFDVTIFVVDPAAGEAVLVAHSGSYIDFLPHGYRQRLSDGIVGWAATHRERCLVNDVTEDPRYMAYEYHSTKSELAVPIRVGEDIVGVVNVEDTRLHAFDETDAIVLETLCDQLGSAINNARLYDELKRTNVKLTELDRMKSDFLGIVSHDFRSPLASIILAARALLKHPENVDPKRLSEYLTIIVDQANRLGMLAEDTLSITRLESGQLTFLHKVVNVERLIKDAVALVTFSRRHSIDYRVDPGVSYIKGDQAKLRQVVQNLLSNAVKYSPHGGKIAVVAADYDNDHMIMSVTDEGIGIPADQIGRLFQKFSRVNTGEARDIKGSGLGLWICREIVKAHGGEIWVKSVYGEGSMFCFTLKKAEQDGGERGP